MVPIAKVRALLPPFKNKQVWVTDNQGTKDIINNILDTHNAYTDDYLLIADLFDFGDEFDIGARIWNFCKYQLHYKAESEKRQTVMSPAAIVSPGMNVDCKHYSLFIAGVLNALNQGDNEQIDWAFRFVSEMQNKSIGHVFVVVFLDNGKEIWIDPVLTSFNQRKNYTKQIDKKVMALYKISGVSNQQQVNVSVDKEQAFSNFLVMLNKNYFQIKTLMLNNQDITFGPVQDYCRLNGLDFSRIVNLLYGR